MHVVVTVVIIVVKIIVVIKVVIKPSSIQGKEYRDKEGRGYRYLSLLLFLLLPLHRTVYS